MHFSILNIGRGGYASSRNTITRQPRTTEPGGDRRDDHPQTVSEGHRRSRRRRAARAPAAGPRAGQPAEPADHHDLENVRRDRQRVVQGKSVTVRVHLGGSRNSKEKKTDAKRDTPLYTTSQNQDQNTIQPNQS